MPKHRPQRRRYNALFDSLPPARQNAHLQIIAAWLMSLIAPHERNVTEPIRHRRTFRRLQARQQ